MTRRQRAFRRLGLVAAAWAAGTVLAPVAGLAAYDDLVSLALAAAAYALTSGPAAGGGRRGGDVKYWRGRPIDDRWN